MTAGDAPGLDVALECAAGEYAKSLLHKVELGAGLELDTPELINEQILAVKNFGRSEYNFNSQRFRLFETVSVLPYVPMRSSLRFALSAMQSASLASMPASRTTSTSAQ